MKTLSVSLVSVLAVGCVAGMVRQLWLLRHADAEPHGTRQDAQRKLTSRGEQQARIAGRAIANMAVSFNSILVSPKVRAQQTAELACRELGADQRAVMETYAPLASDFDGADALEVLAGIGAGERVLLVGHEPDMSGVLCDLTGARVDVKKGGLAMARLEGRSRGELILVMRPHELSLLAGESEL
jgi:phosphohistidine phosphatase